MQIQWTAKDAFYGLSKQTQLDTFLSSTKSSLTSYKMSPQVHRIVLLFTYTSVSKIRITLYSQFAPSTL